ncbi:serine-protein kinase ATM-like isoform X2 [Rhopilema esculentum]|uniref:serine-protein kinase ATM-like isoform X2 n=1 Tax=Rhopilema esculentum TaxID=499914 RepID=UPI0031E1A4EA
MEASESIAEILRYCSGLCAERQTERKSFAGKLLTRLKDPCVQKTIDAASASKGKKKLSWGIISQAVFNYVFKEADILKASSKLTEDTIKRKAKDISETFRAFIQSAEKRGPSLKSGDVFRHIYKIMSDEKTKGWFCNEYTNVLVKNFLSVESHVCELTAKVWHDLVYIYCNCILSPPPRGDTSLFAQTLNHLTLVASNLSHIRGKDLFKFFSCVFKDVRNDRNETVVFYLINALNNFSMNIASDSRGQLCILGEDLFPLLLPLWTKSSAHVKDKLIDFFRLQVDIHHPFGVHQEENGAWSSNEKLWKKCLTKLYEAINGEFHQLAGKLQLSGSKAGLAQNSNFVELAVGTFHQMFYLTNKNNKNSDSLAAENKSSRKRRKTESGWQSVIDGISLVSCPTACVAWLQFLASYVGQYASSFPSSEYLRFLNCLYQAIINCKRADVLSFVLQALRSLADNTDSFKSEHLRNRKEIETCWRNIWFETMKAIHSRNVDEPGFMLLTAILKADLLVSLENPYRAFFSSGTRVSRESLALLICLLQGFPIPEKLNSHMEIYSSFEKSSKHQGRKKIIELVLPDIEFIIAQKDFSQLLSSRSSDSNTASAVVLLSMIQKNPSAFLKTDVIKSNWMSAKESDSYGKTMKKIGELYLQSSFNFVCYFFIFPSLVCFR